MIVISVCILTFSETCDGHIKPKFKDGCKIFVLDHCQGAGKVCLVYPKKKGKWKFTL